MSADGGAGAVGRDPVADLQAETVRAVLERVPDAERWVAVDYPMHWNVGDAAITLGQARLAHEGRTPIVRVLDRASYRPHLLDRGALPVIAGGGNWGGLYPTHHKLRLRVLGDTVGRPVLQMPQSIEYASEEHREALRRAVARHGCLTFLVRDRRSFELAERDYDCPVHLVPDLVFALGRLPAGPARRDLVAQVRTDKEASEATPAGAGDASHVFDWLQPPHTSPSRAALAAAVLANRLQPRLPLATTGHLSVQTTERLARTNLRRGLRLLSRGRYVVTDRLHGHVLAHLMGRPHVAVNDRFGKVQALHDTWLGDQPGSLLVHSWDEVPSALDRLRQEFPHG